ncbi:hypothetical protein [Advenella kashmirensis]|uniref:hypothetical protein n=1 Tax=Advenella kashmirensis TaxID=310575 RepID=UPI0012DE609F|nr:hypothetical protein [Advenella kashmirensis]
MSIRLPKQKHKHKIDPLYRLAVSTISRPKDKHFLPAVSNMYLFAGHRQLRSKPSYHKRIGAGMWYSFNNQFNQNHKIIP